MVGAWESKAGRAPSRALSSASGTSGDIDWGTFEEARAFARSLGLESRQDWVEWCMSGQRPQDIPVDPSLIYDGEGGPWQGWPDFLGYELRGSCSRSRGWRSFEEARRFVWGLGLKSVEEWKDWSKSGQRPQTDIPSNPNQVYEEEGWLSWGDFLGYVAVEMRPFEEARDYIRSLGLKSTEEWYEWTKSGLRPRDIPSNPLLVYKGKGWLSWGDFLGYRPGYVEGGWRTFEEARDYVKTLGLKSQIEWKEWCKSDQKPHDIHFCPDEVYKEEGWLSWGDFLGYRPGHVARKRGTTKKLSFTEARDYVRRLGLKSHKEWRELCKSGQRPSDIYSNPNQGYKDKGWLSWGDFLGFDEGYDAGADWRSFEDARDFVRSLELKSKEEWWEWCKNGQRPHDIPSHPDRDYKEEGWLSWPDFLGYRPGHVARKRGTTEKLPFTEARDYVRRLGLKSVKEWRELCKSGQRPSDIYSSPNQGYKDKGWLSWGDFLGFNEGYDAGAEWRSFEDARHFVRSLKLKSVKQFREWSQSDDKPPDIPTNPEKVYKGKGWKTWGDFLG